MDGIVKRATIGLLVFLLCVTIAYGVYTLTIPTDGYVGSAGLTANPSSITWGTIGLDEPQTQIVTLTNTGDFPFTNLGMTYTMPAGFTGTLTWNCTGQSVGLGSSIIANFTLTMTSGSGSFSFDIDVTGDV